ncbi:pteridine reductase [Legionella anisa]|uniref:KR domain-containing protein n=1 Tax=Legionella anisa TaxID=28082 RepID=A0AAX0WYH8_9GAMM|nr:pteridine reductase [Legionella anisa]AWN72759.1 pteridine reductase [Legionella anisa]KTC73011.1 pteridine reductase [Legionella anisa]MCW8423550.1 pteridine reductase [Legionella anisa]MCW8447070.1 pteridine reductase [Legionella anisa]PNL63215.1 KR domain-containing protein [Legionella anisa]
MNPTNKQEVKVALVTGGARRIGAAIVQKLHAAGYKVVIHCHHSLQEAHALAVDLNEQRPNSAFVLQRELSETSAAAEMMTAIQDWAGRLDLLVNNASVFIRTEFTAFAETDWDVLFDVHVKAPFLLSLAARPLLAKHSGAIINVSDTHAEKPLKGYSVYCQSKAALEMQTKSLAREFAPEIRVNAVAPGAIAWPENANTLTPEIQEKIIAKTPLKKHGDPEYVAQAILALAENPYITGQILKVDGGRNLLG